MSRSLLLAAMLALVGGAFAFGSAAAQEEGIALSPLNDSGVTGTATVTSDGQQTVVEVSIEGSTADAVHPNHLHTGTSCDDYTTIDYNLTDIEVGADGTGTATTTLDAPIEEVEGTPRVIVAHTGPTLQDDPTPIACGVLPVAIVSPPAGEEPEVAAPPAAGSGGFLDGGSAGVPTVALILLGSAGALLAAGAFAWRLSRTQR